MWTAQIVCTKNKELVDHKVISSNSAGQTSTIETYKLQTYTVFFDLEKDEKKNHTCPICGRSIEIQTHKRRVRTDEELLEELRKNGSLKSLFIGAFIILIIIAIITAFAYYNKGNALPANLIVVLIYLLSLIKPIMRVVSSKKSLSDTSKYLREIGYYKRNIPYEFSIDETEILNHYLYDISFSVAGPNISNYHQYKSRRWWDLPDQSVPVNFDKSYAKVWQD
jgi:hypothetical protein